MRYVVTGLGVACSIGNNVDETWKAALAGKCDIKELKSIDTSDCDVKLAAEASGFEATHKRFGKYKRIFDRVSLMSIEAANEAIVNAHIDLSKTDLGRIGVAVGTCTGGISSLERAIRGMVHSTRIYPKDLLKQMIGFVPLQTCGPKLITWLVFSPLLDLLPHFSYPHLFTS